MAAKAKPFDAGLIDDVGRRLASDLPVRRTLPAGGRLHIDRQLPFLVVHRLDDRDDRVSAARFVRGEAAYLVAPAGRKYHARVAALLTRIADEMVAVFGAFLIIEVWTGNETPNHVDELGKTPRPGFRVVVPRRDEEQPSVQRLVSTLGRIKVLRQPADVVLVPGGRLSPPGVTRLSPHFGTAKSPVKLIGVEVTPIHRDPQTDAEYPEITRALHRQLSAAFQQCAYEFALHQTTHRPRHYQSLGRRAIVRAVTTVDAQLAEIAAAFDLLMFVSPIDADRAWRVFRRHEGRRPPRFAYRPIDVDVPALKRKLYSVPIDRVEDPTLAAIFREKQRETSLELDLLTDRETDRFRYTGVALYGSVEPDMVTEARRILEALEPQNAGRSRSVGAEAFAERARQEIERYRRVLPEMGATVQIRDDTTSLVVSRGHLVVGSRMRFPVARVEALIQHEVGTHVTTYWNGSGQRLKLLASGLAGYSELQEGLAVLAEYLVAGLTPGRLRTLAGRVVAAHAVLDGAEFADTYGLLTQDHGFAGRPAFLMAMRVHRSGGFVKDAIYLRGLSKVVNYLAEGGRIDTLLVGKIAVEHVAVIEELQRRGVLTAAPLRPGYLDDPDTHYRLERLRGGLDLVRLAE